MDFVARLRLLDPFRVLSLQYPLAWSCHRPATEFAAKDVDLMIVQRACFPSVKSLERGLRTLSRMRRAGTRVVYELDDHIFCPGLRQLIESSIIDEVDERSYRRHQAHLLLFDVVDAVICSTPNLAMAVRGLGVSVPIYVIPTAPNFADPRWSLPLSLPPKSLQRKIGWSGGSRVGGDLEILVPVIERVLRERPDVTFVLSGSTKYARLFARCPQRRVLKVPWVPYHLYPGMISEFDLALIPIEDNPYNRCKSPLKAIDFGAVGVPVVCSADSCCAGTVQAGRTGWTARSPQDWITCIEAHLDAKIWAGAKRRKLAETTRRRYGYSRLAPRHWQVLQKIVNPHSGD